MWGRWRRSARDEHTTDRILTRVGTHGGSTSCTNSIFALVTTEFNRRTLFKGAAGAVGAASALAMGGNGLFNLGFQYAQSVLAQTA